VIMRAFTPGITGIRYGLKNMSPSSRKLSSITFLPVDCITRPGFVALRCEDGSVAKLMPFVLLLSDCAQSLSPLFQEHHPKKGAQARDGDTALLVKERPWEVAQLPKSWGSALLFEEFRKLAEAWRAWVAPRAGTPESSRTPETHHARSTTPSQIRDAMNDDRHEPVATQIPYAVAKVDLL
jgi:hypothetical protein